MIIKHIALFIHRRPILKKFTFHLLDLTPKLKTLVISYSFSNILTTESHAKRKLICPDELSNHANRVFIKLTRKKK